jgi:hypothetical protein
MWLWERLLSDSQQRFEEINISIVYAAKNFLAADKKYFLKYIR